MREVITSRKTLRGEKIVENMKAPSIDILDVLFDAQFNLGYALAATIAHRDGASSTANLLFYKSCLFGTRTLVMEKTGTIPATYDDIANAIPNLDLGEYAELVRSAYQARQSGNYDPAMLFKNISYLNQRVIPLLASRMSRDGPTAVVVA